MTSENHKDNSVTQVVLSHLCTGCGTCFIACPVNALSIQEDKLGLLTPKVNKEICNNCGRCLKVCPGLDMDLDVDIIDPFKGNIQGFYVGKTTDNSILTQSQSGGIATSLIMYLFENKLIDRAILVRLSQNKPIRSEVFIASSPDEVLQAAGSKYCPVALNTALREIPKNSRVAIVGLPCHIHGIIKYKKVLGFDFEIAILIGLICDRTLSFKAIDFLLEQACGSADISEFKFRSKKWRGWPGDIEIHQADGRNFFLPGRKRRELKDFFTPIRCRTCFDKFNIFADLVLGDAWGFSNDKNGESSIIVRTARGLELIRNAQENKKIVLRNENINSFFIKNGLEYKKLSLKCFSDLWSQQGNKIPKLNMLLNRDKSIPAEEIKKQRQIINIISSISAAADDKTMFDYVQKELEFRHLKKMPVVKRVYRFLKERLFVSRH